MTDKQTCDGLDCAWCVVFDCPIENERRKARVKELEEENDHLVDVNKKVKAKLDVQFAEMEEKLTAEEFKNFELKEEIKELKELNIRLNNQREIYYKEYLKIDKKLDIAEKALKDIASGVFLPAYRSYLAEQALQKMEEVK